MKKTMLSRPHPWHGLSAGENAPETVLCFIEMVPTDTVKYEIDKESGYLSIDRPQEYSSILPAMYGFIPRTYCAERVASMTNNYLERTDIEGDNDPIDICVLTEKDVTHGDIIARARPIGGLRFLDRNKADDKIIAVLENDAIYGGYTDIGQLPKRVTDRLIHYFATYKDPPMVPFPRGIMKCAYGMEAAHEVIIEATKDYEAHFGLNPLNGM